MPQTTNSNPPHRFGWIPDKPDFRDFTYAAPPPVLKNLPPKVDLRSGCPPIYDQGNLGSCHDADTEVLTDQGWFRFSHLDGSERLATVNPETSFLTYEVPTRLIRFHYKGKLLCVKNQSLNFRVTPDHKMLVRKWDEHNRRLSDKYQLIAAKDLGWYCGLMNRVVWKGESVSDKFTLPGVDHKHQPQRESLDVPMAAWLRFLGIYLAEGTMLKRDQRPDRISYKIQIAASKEREKEFIRATLSELGVNALELGDRFTFDNKRIYEAMSLLGLEGVKAGDKFVPSFIFSQSAEMIKEFLAGHFAGDGSEQNGLKAHYTSSKRLADDLQTLIFLSGQETRVSIREGRMSATADGRTIQARLPAYRVSVCERKNLSIERANALVWEDYDGEVFCAEVPTHHTLITRREGRILISGNCTANAIAAAIEFDRKKQGLDDFVSSRLFIYYNERAMEGTIHSDAGAEIRDGIKSVAAQGACPESEWKYDISKFAVKPPHKCYKDALKYRTVSYQRINHMLNQMKGCLADGYPFIYGITVYSSFPMETTTGAIPMPKSNEEVEGGHAMLAVGYDDETRRFLVRNPWGTGWGMAGYGTIPYEYLINPNLGDDYWTIRVVQ